MVALLAELEASWYFNIFRCLGAVANAIHKLCETYGL